MKEIINQLNALQTADWLIICTVIIAYIPLWKAIHKDKENGAGQNFYTYVLWLILDIAQPISIAIAGGVYVMFFAYAPCCLFAVILLRKHRKPINVFEKVVIVLTITCIPIWVFYGEIWAIIIQTVAQVVAGLPLLRDTWSRTSEFKKTLFPLFLFAIAHLISFFRREGWSIENTLFPTVMLMYTILNIYPIFKIWFMEWRKRNIFPWT